MGRARRGGDLLPCTGDSLESRGSRPPASSGSSITSPSPYRAWLFPGQYSQMGYTLQGWELNLHGNSATLRMGQFQPCIPRTKAFRSFIWCLSWEFKALTSSFSFTTSSSNIRGNQPMSFIVPSFLIMFESIIIWSYWTGCSGVSNAEIFCVLPWRVHIVDYQGSLYWGSKSH